jgi:hypothetical protein
LQLQNIAVPSTKAENLPQVKALQNLLEVSEYRRASNRNERGQFRKAA